MKEIDAALAQYDSKPWIKMPIAELLTPAPGRICKAPAYWAVTPDECVLFFKTYHSPQCNTVKKIVEHIRPGLEVRHLGVTFVPHKCEDYV